MSTYEPQFDADNNSENFQSIVERMFRAKWITGKNMATREQLWLCFSDLGQQRMKKISDALRRTAPEFFNPANTSTLTPESIQQPSPDELIAFMTEVGVIVAELQPPLFSREELDTVIGIMLCYTREAARRDISPPRY